MQPELKFIVTLRLVDWCEYKRNLGVEFGEYSLRQYRYAKEYYRIVQDELKKQKEREDN